MSYQDGLTRVIEEIAAPRATDIDTTGAFPRDAIDALGKEGILGLTVAEDFGGGGGSLADAADVIKQLAEVCGSTAMVVLMHYAGTILIENHGPDDVRRAIGAGRHLTSLAFSERGSRSHFWAPQSSAVDKDGMIHLDAQKSWVTSAGEADSYVWSSRPLSSDAPMTLWFVPADTAGLRVAGNFDGLGLRGNNSKPIEASDATVPASARLGDDGAGLDLALSEVLPWFLVMSASFSVGTMEAVVAETGRHITTTRLEHLDQSMAEQPLVRVDHARMRIATDQAAALVSDTLSALGSGRADAMLRVLEVKAAAGEAAITVTDLAMKICGGAAFRKELGVERRFRDSRAARVMAPTTDALLDFVGRAINDLPLL